MVLQVVTEAQGEAQLQVEELLEREIKEIMEELLLMEEVLIVQEVEEEEQVQSEEMVQLHPQQVMEAQDMIIRVFTEQDSELVEQ
jgi:hypothetical protein